MTLREDLVACVDAARDIIDDLDLNPHTTLIRTRTWSGTQIGSGTPTDVDVAITPKPLVSFPTPRLIAAEPGKFERGDRIISQITRTLTEADLIDSGLAATQERFFVINGDEYRIRGKPETRNFEFVVQVRRVKSRP